MNECITKLILQHTNFANVEITTKIKNTCAIYNMNFQFQMVIKPEIQGESRPIKNYMWMLKKLAMN